MATTFPLERVRHYVLPAVAALIGLGVAIGIATVPSDVLNAAVDRAGFNSVLPAAASPIGTTGRTILALVAGALIAACGFAPQAKAWLVERLDTFARKPADSGRALHDDEEEPPVIRRADAHPDAPPRRPIRAASDLGDPLPIFGEEDERSAPLPPPAEQPLPADLDRPLADFDPAAVPLRPMAPPEPIAPLLHRPGSNGKVDDVAIDVPEWVDASDQLPLASAESQHWPEENAWRWFEDEASRPKPMAPTLDRSASGQATSIEEVALGVATNPPADQQERSDIDYSDKAPAVMPTAAVASPEAQMPPPLSPKLVVASAAPRGDAPDESIAGLLARLERGAAQRRVVATPMPAPASAPVQPPAPPPVSEPAPVSLDDTLQRLRRLAAG
ncbi:hypothetical protein [Sphingomonas sp. Mn802worker]|uniref:hypothetical protein n=1 Tax=Sphingomonas sp. Mn802worker TaxID=629773 RepID=UPI0012EAC6D8|nr:hypothetical protein [Sphingomonas sp. Mn802worker]